MLKLSASALGLIQSINYDARLLCVSPLGLNIYCRVISERKLPVKNVSPITNFSQLSFFPEFIFTFTPF